MPKIKSYTPAWLSKPASGHEVFAPSEESHNYQFSPKSKSKSSPRRTIVARNASQIFVAVGKEVRWADLSMLKETYREQQIAQGHISRQPSDSDDDDSWAAFAREGKAGFRTLQVPVVTEIEQLVLSPNGDFLAILTSHTVRICAMPDTTALLHFKDTIKPKTWTLGPTTHVFDRSPVASALWHPLGVDGSALVTVTTDAVVRVWELSPIDRWSFDKPTLTIDLRKLADGTHVDENFSASHDTTSKGFSLDTLEMDVAAACFPSRGSGGWSPMTLWIAMREGDIYALCPLLPTKWSPPATLIPSLSVAIVANMAAIQDDPDVSPQAKLLAQQQYDWMSDLDNQEPVEGKPALGKYPTEIFTRPSRPGVVPRLQGPFMLEVSPDTELDIDLQLTDIYVIGKKLDVAELMMGEDEELEVDAIHREGSSLSIVCLLSMSGQVRICLDLDEVQAQWLPPRHKWKAIERLSTLAPPSLLTFQTLDTLNNLEMSEEAWPMLSPDPLSRYSFYVTHPSSITYISLWPWVFRLESDLQGDTEAGSDFRIDLLVKGHSSTRERLYTAPGLGDINPPLAAAVVMKDADVGYIVLSATPNEALALILEVPDGELEPFGPVSPNYSNQEDMQPLDFYEPRPVFQEPHVFEISSGLPTFLEKLRTSRHKGIVGQEIRLSPVTLQIFTQAHKILSDETHRLAGAASELFRRLESLQLELKQQIAKSNEVRARVEAISGEDDPENPETHSAAVERRLEAARARAESIRQRLEKMRKTVGKEKARELSDKEKAWISEVKMLDSSISGSTTATADDRSSRIKQVRKRYDEAKMLKEDLISQAEELMQAETDDDEDGENNSNNGNGSNVAAASSPDLRIPEELRKAKIKQVQMQLERETALVDAVKTRLERLSLT